MELALNSSDLPTDNSTTSSPPAYNEIANVYYFAMMTVGLTVKLLHRVYKKKKTILNPFFLLPLTSMVGTLIYMFLDNERYVLPYASGGLTFFL
jgi:hypothetical protein